MIFVDTAFWVAMSNRRDPLHHDADALLHRHHEATLVTTNHVRGETWTLLRRRSGHADAVSFLDRLQHSSRVRLVFVSQDLEREAEVWLRRHDERPYSFVDASSFAVMRQMRIGDVLTFDADFAVAGFTMLGST